MKKRSKLIRKWPIGACKHEAIFLLLVPSRLPYEFEVSLQGWFVSLVVFCFVLFLFFVFFYDHIGNFAVVKTFPTLTDFIVLATAAKYKLAALL